jgi:hypothetical protein
MRNAVKGIVLSNNPLVLERFCDAVPVGGGPCEVFKEALNFLDRGFTLSSHALSGSVRLSCNPYRSLVLKPSPGDPIDRTGIGVLLDAIDRADSASRMRPVPPGLKPDYAVIDLDLLESQFL